MATSFRVKVRIKRLKQFDSTEWQNKISEQYRKAAQDAWKNVPSHPPLIANPRCPRCGVDQYGATPFPCMHGSECGQPWPMQMPKSVFIPTVWISPQPPYTSATPSLLTQSTPTSARNEQIWN